MKTRSKHKRAPLPRVFVDVARERAMPPTASSNAAALSHAVHKFLKGRLKARNKRDAPENTWAARALVGDEALHPKEYYEAWDMFDDNEMQRCAPARGSRATARPRR